MPDLVLSKTYNTENIPLWEDVLEITEKQPGQKGVSLCYLNYKNHINRKFEVQLGKSDEDYTTTPFGVSAWSGQVENRMELSVALPPSAVEVFKDLDAFIVQHAKKKHREWWPDIDNFEDLNYRSCVMHNNVEYEPLLKSKIKLYNPNKEELAAGVYNLVNNEIVQLGNTEVDRVKKVEALKARANLIVTVAPTAIWFKNKSLEWGLTIETKNVAVVPQQQDQRQETFMFDGMFTKTIAT